MTARPPVRRSVRVGNLDVDYEASVDEFLVSDSKDRPGARIVCTTYLRCVDTQAERISRPVIFAFNGGPGSSSVWLHLGLGPRRVADADSLRPRTAPPFSLVDNEQTVLDAADLVFIDPPGTGYSRVLTPEQEVDFYSVDGDARATLEFINAWIRQHHRENSPRYVLGESYGGTRAAAVSRLAPGGPYLSGSLSQTALSGAILIGAPLAPSQGEAAHAVAIPVQAATAWYHKMLPQPMQGLDEHLAKAYRFAAEEYLPALFAGTSLTQTAREAVASSLHELIGISPDVLLENNLRLTPDQFSKLLLSQAGLEVGLYDSRFSLTTQHRGQDVIADDPAMGQYAPLFTGTLVSYLRDELGADYDEEYRFIEFKRINFRWDYGEGPGRYKQSELLPEFAVAMRRNQQFRLMIGQGYFDQVSSIGALEHALTRPLVDRSRIEVRYYDSGHMPYLGSPSRSQVAADIREFVAALPLESEEATKIERLSASAVTI
jgi:carboxypeptidase C (cathepsin A)